MRPHEDLTGRRFGYLTALERAPKGTKSRTSWLCECECGRRKVVLAFNLKSGASRSCGCRVRAATIARSTTHGKNLTPEHKVWKGLRKRCRNRNEGGYSNYGGRGIAVCERWDQFENFLADMGERPSSKHTIDRVDNDGPYSPDNCRWATRRAQMNNVRKNVLLEHGGCRFSVAQWARVLSVPAFRIYSRLRAGWSVDAALFRPVAFRRTF